jgi:hypothetical protein
VGAQVAAARRPRPDRDRQRRGGRLGAQRRQARRRPAAGELGARAAAARQQGEGRGPRHEPAQVAQVAPPARQPGGERAAARAPAQVGADLAAAQYPPVAARDVAAHELAGQRAAALGLEQRLARLVDRLLGRAGRDVQRGPDLPVAEPAELAQDERGALVVRQRQQVGAQRRQPLVQLGVGRGVVGRRQVGVQRVVRPPAAQDVDRLVVGDPEEPGPQRDVALRGVPRMPQRRPRAVGRLARVVGILQQPLAEPQHVVLLVAVERGERRAVAGTEAMPQDLRVRVRHRPPSGRHRAACQDHAAAPAGGVRARGRRAPRGARPAQAEGRLRRPPPAAWPPSAARPACPTAPGRRSG